MITLLCNYVTEYYACSGYSHYVIHVKIRIFLLCTHILPPPPASCVRRQHTPPTPTKQQPQQRQQQQHQQLRSASVDARWGPWNASAICLLCGCSSWLPWWRCEAMPILDSVNIPLNEQPLSCGPVRLAVMEALQRQDLPVPRIVFPAYSNHTCCNDRPSALLHLQLLRPEQLLLQQLLRLPWC